jgi:hypothetical protein
MQLYFLCFLPGGSSTQCPLATLHHIITTLVSSYRSRHELVCEPVSSCSLKAGEVKDQGYQSSA